MPPIILHSSWDERPTDSKEKVEPLRKYFFIFEGQNTEYFYFSKLKNLKTEIGIDPLIDLVVIEKTGVDQNITYPKHLINLAKKTIYDDQFDEERDKMIVVFDTDIFSEKVEKEKFQELLEDIQQERNKNIELGLTNPNFELFLLLHIEDSIKSIIDPNKDEILKNAKIKNQRPSYCYLQKATSMNCKKNKKIGDLAKNIDTAIEQEKLINQDPKQCLENLTSNIASIIEKIKSEKLPF